MANGVGGEQGRTLVSDLAKLSYRDSADRLGISADAAMRGLALAASMTASTLFLVGCSQPTPSEIAAEVCPFIASTKADEGLARMELLTDKGGLAPLEAAEANRTYEEIALSAASSEAPQSACINSVSAALGDKEAKNRVQQSIGEVQLSALKARHAEEDRERLAVQKRLIDNSIRRIEENSTRFGY